MADAGKEIRRLRNELRNLDQRQSDLMDEIRRLQAANEAERISNSVTTVDSRSSQSDKIRLFRSLFSGREDVFPVRFENRKSGRSGYQPACRNEWRPGVCRKPKVKCAKCEYREFVPVSDEIVRQHLSGMDQNDRPFTMGVYPLREDETCSFLAVDFDKEQWPLDSDDTFAYIAGYTPGGAPYGVTWEEWEQIEHEET